MKTNVSKEIVLQAIAKVNTEQGYQIELNRSDYTGKWFNFTLKSKSKIPGARISTSGRNLPCASWHAHGFIFDAIFKIVPDAMIIALGKKITKNENNWQDMPIGQGMFLSNVSIL